MCYFMCSTYNNVKINGKEIWNSKGKRFKAVKFICNFCGKLIWNQTFSIVDGLRSCKKCDEIYNK